MAEQGLLKISSSIQAIRTLATTQNQLFQNSGNKPKACNILRSIHSKTLKQLNLGKKSKLCSILNSHSSHPSSLVALKINILFCPQPAASIVSLHGFHFIIIANTSTKACWFLTFGGHHAMCPSPAQTESPVWWGSDSWTCELRLWALPLPNGMDNIPCKGIHEQSKNPN